jgi:hypothetical protein
MAKNIVLMIYTLVVLVGLVLLVSGKLRWASEEEADEMPERVAMLGQAIEMHRPQVLEVGDQQILHVPTSKLVGSHWSVSHEFYIYADGTLKRIDFSQQ